MSSSTSKSRASVSGAGGGGSGPHAAGAGESLSLTEDGHKTLGNRYFSLYNFEKAIQCYTCAIAKNQTNPIYYTNRALAAFRLSRFNDCMADCRAALELDLSNVKAHFFLGQALCETGSIEDGLYHLQRTVDLIREQRLNYGDDAANIVRKWRKRKLSLQEEKRLADESRLQAYLSRLVREDSERKMEELSKDFEENQNDKEYIEGVEHINRQTESVLSQLNNLIISADEKRRKRDVPDYLCGKISFVLLRDPVITPSGITYERKDIEDHLLKLGHFDPVTRVQLTADQLIPNYSMKEVVSAFLAENEWATDM